jgi:hypothetical protein
MEEMVLKHEISSSEVSNESNSPETNENKKSLALRGIMTWTKAGGALSTKKPNQPEEKVDENNIVVTPETVMKATGAK